MDNRQGISLSADEHFLGPGLFYRVVCFTCSVDFAMLVNNSVIICLKYLDIRW